MTEADFILSILDEHYSLITGDISFLIKDNFTNEKYHCYEFKVDVFIKIIGDYQINDNLSSIIIFNNWLNSKKELLVKDLYDYLNSMDLSKGGVILSDEIHDRFITNPNYSYAFINNYFNDYYYEKVIIPNTVDHFDKLDWNRNIVYLLDTLYKKHSKDTSHHNHLITLALKSYYKNNILKTKIDNRIREINALTEVKVFDKDFIEQYSNHNIKSLFDEWYFDNMLGYKVKDFISQLVVTLGKFNWVVTWIGHGEVTEATLRTVFKDEGSIYFSMAKRYYEQWYDKAIIERSEKLMKNCF